MDPVISGGVAWLMKWWGHFIDREIEIVHELQVRTLASEKLLMESVHLMAELDWYAPCGSF